MAGKGFDPHVIEAAGTVVEEAGWKTAPRCNGNSQFETPNPRYPNGQCVSPAQAQHDAEFGATVVLPGSPYFEPERGDFNNLRPNIPNIPNAVPFLKDFLGR